jgi:hypothetical protein
VLRFDLGQLALGPHDEPNSRPHGWRHLTIKSPWRLQTGAQVLCDWNAKSGAEGEILKVASQLVGLTVKGVQTSPPAWDLELHWSNHTTLVVFSDSNEDRDDAWFILGTDGLEIIAGPSRDAQGWSVRWVK